jgi:hypothetical protein
MWYVLEIKPTDDVCSDLTARQNNQTESANNPNEAYNLPIDFYPLEELRRVQALVGIYSHEVPNNAHGHFPDVAMFMGSSPHSRPLHVNPSLLHDSAPAYQMSDSAHSHSLEGNPYPLVVCASPFLLVHILSLLT